MTPIASKRPGWMTVHRFDGSPFRSWGMPGARTATVTTMTTMLINANALALLSLAMSRWRDNG